jgi:hypothetical protein
MMRSWIGAVLAAVTFLVALPASAQAPARAPAPRKVALIIGNSDYLHAPQLPSTLSDAADVASRLQALGFDVIDGYDLDAAAMQARVRDFARVLSGAQVGLFYYAGHAFQMGGRNYLIPVDAALADEADVAAQAVDMGLVQKELEREPQRLNLVFLDACRDFPLSANLAHKAGRGLGQINASPPALVAFAAQPGATAADGKEHNSAFTGALLHHLETPGLEVRQLMNRVRNSVIASSGGLQIPWDSASLTQGFYFVTAPEGLITPSEAAWKPPAHQPSGRQLEINIWTEARNGESADDLQTYLRAFPNGLFANAARVRLARLERPTPAQQAEESGRVAEIGPSPAPRPVPAAPKVTLTTTRSNTGWTLSIGLAEPARAVLISSGGGPFKPTGYAQQNDPRTGAPAPITELTLPADAGTLTLAVKYVDLGGAERGPFAFAFDPQAALAAQQIALLMRIRGSWVTIQDDPKYPNTYFTTLVANRCGLKQARYGWDNDAPTEVFPLPRCDAAHPGDVPADAATFIPTKPGARAINVELFFADGKRSEVLKFAAPH